MTYSLELDFKSSKQNKLRINAIAQIYLKVHTADERGLIFITHECASFSEIESEINRLMKELEELKKKAKKHFEAEK